MNRESYLLQRIADLGQNEQFLNIKFEDGYYFISVGKYQYVLTVFTEENLLEAYVFIKAALMKNDWKFV